MAMLAFDVDDYPEEKIIYDQTPIRLFNANGLERLTHITPLVILVLYVPVLLGSLVLGAWGWNKDTPIWTFPFAFATGFVALWTFVEYILHRFVFHFQPRNKFQATAVFLFHGVHHVQPHVKTRLVMPPTVSIPMSFVFFAAFHYGVGLGLGLPIMVWPMFAGFTLGYLCYDLIHYATHHLPLRGRIMKFLKRHHMEHHFKTPNARFGVSTSLWDQVFRTEPAK